MRSFLVSAALAAFRFSSVISGLNILMGNDDGFGSVQIREFYRLLKAGGNEVVMMAPVDNKSGQGRRAVYSSMSTLAQDSEYSIVAAGVQHLELIRMILTSGTETTDDGTPAAGTFVAIDYVIPNFYGNKMFDLYVGGPNFGNNLGPFLYTLSGKMGGTYAAISRGLPGIAFSGGNGDQRSYHWLNVTAKSGFPDPATIQAQLSVDIVNQLVNMTAAGQPLPPLGYGIGVNASYITSLNNKSCIALPFFQALLTGNAFTGTAVYNSTRKTFTYGNSVGPGLNFCINGDCSLPGEQTVLSSGCYSSVSVFTVDYDAPAGLARTEIRSNLEGLVKVSGRLMGEEADDW